MWRYALTGLLVLSGCNAIFGINGATQKPGGDDDDIDAPGDSDGSGSAATCVTAGCDGTSTTPFCGDDGACRACASNSECDVSNACIPVDSGDARAGGCADVGDVAYVTPTGTTNSLCDTTHPCTLAAAITTARPFVRMTGEIHEVANLMAPVMILADDGASLTGSAPVLQTNADLHVYGLEIAAISSTDHVVEIKAGSTFLEGVHVTGGTLGIEARGTRLTVTRSKIDTNSLGGIEVSTGGFDITNNFVVHNGMDGASIANIGGINLHSRDATSRLDYNTIADNGVGSGAGASVAAGLTCGFAPDLDVANNILAANQHGQSMTPTNVFGSCKLTIPNSIDQADFANLFFADPTGLDYHVTNKSSLAVDNGKASGGTPVNVDIDGNKRPQNNVPDIGAHELPQ
jgi:hypothetical protein